MPSGSVAATRAAPSASMSKMATRTPLARSAATTPAPISVAPPVTMAAMPASLPLPW